MNPNTTFTVYQQGRFYSKLEVFLYVKNLQEKVRYISSLLVTIAHFESVLRQASNKLPVITEFIDRSAQPRLGSILINPDTGVEVDTRDTARSL